jgi:hypothetical protein
MSSCLACAYLTLSALFILWVPLGKWPEAPGSVVNVDPGSPDPYEAPILYFAED